MKNDRKDRCPNPKCEATLVVIFTEKETDGRGSMIHQRFCPECKCLVEFQHNGRSSVLASPNTPFLANA